MDSTFPFSIYSKYSGANNEERPQQQSYSSNTASSLDRSVNSIARNIANVVIKSSSEDCDEDQTQHTTIKLPHIPKEILLFSAVILAKVLLFSAYREAHRHGIQILDL